MWIKIIYGIEIMVGLFALSFVGVLLQDWLSEKFRAKKSVDELWWEMMKDTCQTKYKMYNKR